MPRARQHPAKMFNVGDQVVINAGPRSTLTAEIIEDRGLIGHARQQFYRVRTTDTEPSEPVCFEVSEEHLVPKKVIKAAK